MQYIIDLIKSGEYDKAANAINALSDNDRKILRAICETNGWPAFRNLYFNYQTQTWLG